MRNTLNNLLDSIESRIESLNKGAVEEIERIRKYAAEANAYSLVTFLPGFIKNLEDTQRRIDELNEQKRMLLWIVSKEEQA